MAKKRASASTVRAAIKKLQAEHGWNASGIISLLRGGGSSSKGSDYERDMCRMLSRWWTGGARDDVFWRSAGSGARAKVRGRANQDTAGQHGDIAATDPIGAPLIDMFTIELKRGYSEHTFQDLTDRQADGGVQEWERFFTQTIESWEQAGAYTWLLITRRDRRQALVWTPYHVIVELRTLGAFRNGWPAPLVRMRVVLRGLDSGSRLADVCGLTLEDFLEGVTPTHIRDLEAQV